MLRAQIRCELKTSHSKATIENSDGRNNSLGSADLLDDAVEDRPPCQALQNHVEVIGRVAEHFSHVYYARMRQQAQYPNLTAQKHRSQSIKRANGRSEQQATDKRQFEKTW